MLTLIPGTVLRGAIEKALIALAWPLWMIVGAPLIAEMLRATSGAHRLMGAAAVFAAAWIPGVGAAVYTARRSTRRPDRAL